MTRPALKSGVHRRTPVLALRVMFAAALLLGWKGLAALVGPVYVADPSLVAERLVVGLGDGSALRATSVTLRLAGLGLALGVGAGACLVVLLGRRERVLAAVEGYVMLSAAVPKYALAPILFVWLGIDDAPKYVLVSLLVFYPVFVSGVAALRSLDKKLIVTLKVLGASQAQAMRLMTYSVLPFVLAAMQVAVPRAISGAIVGELLIPTNGLGSLIESARQNLDTVGVFAGVVLATVPAAVLVGGLATVERRWLPWRPEAAEVRLSV